MAAPYVSGALALMKAQFPHDSYFQLINRLFSSTDPLPSLATKCQTGGRLNLQRTLTSVSSRPKNDDFANGYQIAVPTTGGQDHLTATGNNVDATSEAGEPNHAGAPATKSVWWRWTPTSSGTVEIRTQGSTFNTRLAVYTGSTVSSLTLLASNSAPDGCSWSRVSFSASSGVTYRIAVDGCNGAVGSIKLTVGTSGSTSQWTLRFDPSTLHRPPGQFRVTVVGPPNKAVALDRFSSAAKYWTNNYATFTLSAGGTYTYTDAQATNAYRFYRVVLGRATSTPWDSCNAVGYVDLTMPSGYSMIANPLNAPDNRVCALLPSPPDGTMLYKYDDVADSFLINTFDSGQWYDPNMTLVPGEGGLIRNPGTSGFTQSFLGEFLQGYLLNSVPSGLSIRASKVPTSGPVASGLGAPISEGDVVLRMVSGAYQTFAYRNGFWIDGAGQEAAEPVIEVGESFWINKPTDWAQISSVWP